MTRAPSHAYHPLGQATIGFGQSGCIGTQKGLRQTETN